MQVKRYKGIAVYNLTLSFYTYANTVEEANIEAKKYLDNINRQELFRNGIYSLSNMQLEEE